MHLVYFLVDGPSAVTASTLAKYGLSHIRQVGGIQPKPCRVGPNGLSGVLVAAGDVPVHAIKFDANEQTWLFAPDSICLGGKMWAVGFSHASGKPAPDELSRAKQLDGRLITLADGREWLMPMARQWFRVNDNDPPLAWSHVLPRVLQLDDHGNWSPGEVMPKYRSLWDKAVAYDVAVQDALSGLADNQNLSIDFDTIGLVVEALGHNYHIGPVEVSLLGLLDTSSVQTALDTITDVETLGRISREIQEAQAKKSDRPEEIPASGPGLTHAGVESDTYTIAATQ